MNIDKILSTLNDHGVDYLLIGGVNFLLRHEPVLTYDTDVWVRKTDENLRKLCQALVDMEAGWGRTEREWQPVANDPQWLNEQSIYCVTTKYGALDIFFEVLGLEGREVECWNKSIHGKTALGAGYCGLSDRHMLDCQLALSERDRKADRILTLQRALGGST